MIHSKLKDLIDKALAKPSFFIPVRAITEMQEQDNQGVKWLNEAWDKPRETLSC